MKMRCLTMGFNNEIAIAPPLREIRVTFRRVPINVFNSSYSPTQTGARRIKLRKSFNFTVTDNMEGRMI